MLLIGCRFIDYKLYIENSYLLNIRYMNIKEKLWNRIRELRKEKWISQEKLGFKSKLHRTYLSNVERGLKNVSVENIEKIAGALDIEIRDLFN